MVMMLLNDLIEGDLLAIQTKAVARIGCLLVIQNVNAGEFGELLIELEAVSSPDLESHLLLEFHGAEWWRCPER